MMATHILQACDHEDNIIYKLMKPCLGSSQTAMKPVKRNLNYKGGITGIRGNNNQGTNHCC